MGIAVVIVITSAIWPFAKLCLLLVAWLLPPRYLSVGRRGRILDMLDAWGKYSFLDSWFLVITLSGLSLEWESLGSMASLQIQTKPGLAFYAYLVATILSLVLGHVASECHHNCALSHADKAVDLEVAHTTRDSTADMLAPLNNFASSEKERRWLLC